MAEKKGNNQKGPTPEQNESKPEDLTGVQDVPQQGFASIETDQDIAPQLKVSAPAEPGGLKFSIMNKLIALALAVSIIPIALIGYLSYENASATLEKQALDGLTAIAQGREDAIRILLKLRMEQIEILAVNEVVQILIGNWNTKEKGATLDEAALQKEADNFIKTELPEFSEITVFFEYTFIGETGKVYFSTDKSIIGKDMSSNEVFRRGLRGKFVSDVKIDKKTGKQFFGVVVPISSHGAKHKDAMGVIIAKAESTVLNEITTNTEGMGKTGEVYIVNNDGYMITESRFLKDTFLKYKVDTEPVRLFQNQGKIMAGIYSNYRGNQVVGASMGDDLEDFDLGWTILAEIDIGEAFAPVRRLALRIIWIGLLIALVVAFIAYFMAKGITSPLRDVVDRMDQISRAGGDLTQEISIRTSDELGILAGAFNGIQQAFHKIVSRIAHATLSINSSSNEILAASNQQESTSAEQSAQITQIQTTMNQAASTATELSTIAQEMGRFADDVARESQEGTDFIKETNEKMTSVSESNEAVAGKLTVLSEKVEGIGKMLETITSVADQTNLLSLNAAIEAAKAGEYGKGFNVVAQEIRRLADQTSLSSKEIASLIKEIQSASSSSLMAMEKSSKDVDEGTNLVKNLGNRFSSINGKIENIQNQFENTIKGIDEQAAGNKEVAVTLNQMTEALKLTAASAVQSRKSAMDLNAMAQQLRSAVGQFKLK